MGAQAIESERAARAKVAKTAAPIRARLPKSFTDRDRDTFIEEAFEHIANVFEVSLKALADENERCEIRFKRRSDSGFTATVYRDGNTAAECMVWYETGGLHGRGIQLSYNASSQGGYNEQLRIEEADSALWLRALGMASYGQLKENLNPQTAAEYYWNLLVDRLRWGS